MLESLGIEPDVELVYRALARHGPAPPARAGRGARLPRRRGRAGARRARRRRAGAPRRTTRRYAAAPPAVALGALITERREGLRLAEQALATLAEEHRSAVAGQSISDLIEVVTGVDAIRHRFQQVQQAADGRDAHVHHRAVRRRAAGENTAEPAAVERGVAHPGGAGARRARRAGRHRGGDRLAAPRPRAAGRRPAADEAGARRRRPRPGPARRSRPAASPARCSCSAAACWPPWRPCSRRCGAVPTRSSCPSLESGGDAVQRRRSPTARPQLDRRILGLMLAGLTDQAVADPARPLAAHRAAAAAAPAGPRRRQQPHAARLVRRPARLGLTASPMRSASEKGEGPLMV